MENAKTSKSERATDEPGEEQDVEKTSKGETTIAADVAKEIAANDDSPG